MIASASDFSIFCGNIKRAMIAVHGAAVPKTMVLVMVMIMTLEVMMILIMVKMMILMLFQQYSAILDGDSWSTLIHLTPSASVQMSQSSQ